MAEPPVKRVKLEGEADGEVRPEPEPESGVPPRFRLPIEELMNPPKVDEEQVAALYRLQEDLDKVRLGGRLGGGGGAGPWCSWADADAAPPIL